MGNLSTRSSYNYQRQINNVEEVMDLIIQARYRPRGSVKGILEYVQVLRSDNTYSPPIWRRSTTFSAPETIAGVHPDVITALRAAEEHD